MQILSRCCGSSSATLRGDRVKRMKIYPLGGSADHTVYVDVYDKMFDATIPYDARFFESLTASCSASRG